MMHDNGGELSEEQLMAVAGGGAGDVTIKIPKTWVTTPANYAMAAYVITTKGLSTAWEWVTSW